MPVVEFLFVGRHFVQLACQLITAGLFDGNSGNCVAERSQLAQTRFDFRIREQQPVGSAPKRLEAVKPSIIAQVSRFNVEDFVKHFGFGRLVHWL